MYIYKKQYINNATVVVKVKMIIMIIIIKIGVVIVSGVRKFKNMLYYNVHIYICIYIIYIDVHVVYTYNVQNMF